MERHSCHIAEFRIQRKSMTTRENAGDYAMWRDKTDVSDLSL